MMFIDQIKEMNIAFDFKKQYTVARVPQNYADAEDFALRLVYYLRPYVANKLGIEGRDVVLGAVSENDKVVVLSEDSRPRKWLGSFFHKPSVGSAQFYDDIKPELVIDKMNNLFA